MKKIFTLMAVAAVAVSATAQDNIFKSSGTNVAAATTLVDNDDLTVKTVYASKGGKKNVTICGEEFTGFFQLRVANDPTADDLTGTENADSSPLIVEVKKDITFTIYMRRQQGNATEPNEDGFNPGDNKGLLAINQADMAKVASTIEVQSYEADSKSGNEKAYALCAETFELVPGTYTLYRKGSTIQVYGFKWEGEGSDEPEALMHWDFTNWSKATVDNLLAANANGGNWTDIEKTTATEPTEASKDNCFWQVKATEGISADKYVMANGEVIAELEGLVYTNTTKDRVLAIAVNYPSPDAAGSFGPYHGPQYLWFNSKDLYWFTIPNVPAGATIKMGVESHKVTDARGVELYIGEEKLAAPDGTAVEITKEYKDNEWLVPVTAAETNDVRIKSTNGCHVYYITVTEGEDGGTSAVAAIETEAPAEYYNLQGVRVANPENGIYIKRQGNKAVKVLVK